MTEEQLVEIERKDANGLFPSYGQILRGDNDRSHATIADVRALIAEVRRYRAAIVTASAEKYDELCWDRLCQLLPDAFAPEPTR